LAEQKSETAKNIALGLVCGALAGAAGLWGRLPSGLSGIFIPIAALIAPALLAFLIAKFGAAFAASAALGAVGLAFFVANAASAAYSLALFLPASLAMGLTLFARGPWRTAVAIPALLTGLALYLELCLPSMLEGSNPFAAIQSAVSSLTDETYALIAASGLADEQNLLFVHEAFAGMREVAPQIAMYYILAAAMAFSLADVLIARAFLKLSGVAVRPMAPFTLWQLSKQYGYVSLAAFVGVAAVMLLKLENADAVFAFGVGIISMPLMLTGVCAMEFTLAVSGARAGRRAAFYVFSLLLFPYSLIFFGLMDRLTKGRRRFSAGGDAGER